MQALVETGRSTMAASTPVISDVIDAVDALVLPT
jgi:hypothetical protein